MRDRLQPCRADAKHREDCTCHGNGQTCQTKPVPQGHHGSPGCQPGKSPKDFKCDTSTVHDCGRMMHKIFLLYMEPIWLIKAYVDNVCFFRSKQFRTMVYHKILIGYKDCGKLLRFQAADICPVCQATEKIIYFTATHQIRKFQSQNVCRRGTGKCFKRGQGFRQSITSIPYFYGDIWLNILMECIKGLGQEEMEKHMKKEEEVAADLEDLEPMHGSSTEVSWSSEEWQVKRRDRRTVQRRMRRTRSHQIAGANPVFHTVEMI